MDRLKYVLIAIKALKQFLIATIASLALKLC
jgi:hypothetical protein